MREVDARGAVEACVVEAVDERDFEMRGELFELRLRGLLYGRPRYRIYRRTGFDTVSCRWGCRPVQTVYRCLLFLPLLEREENVVFVRFGVLWRYEATDGFVCCTDHAGAYGSEEIIRRRLGGQRCRE